MSIFKISNGILEANLSICIGPRRDTRKWVRISSAFGAHRVVRYGHTNLTPSLLRTEAKRENSHDHSPCLRAVDMCPQYCSHVVTNFSKPPSLLLISKEPSSEAFASYWSIFQDSISQVLNVRQVSLSNSCIVTAQHSIKPAFKCLLPYNSVVTR